jgi:hypothetical protein
MKRFVALFCLLPGLAWGQAAVRQTGPVTNNSPVMWATDGIIRQGAGAAGDVAGEMITGGFSAVGKICSFSAPSDQSPNTLCLDGTNSVITLNDVNYSPTIGSGNVSGPNPTTVNAVALWNSTTGTALANSALNGYQTVMTHPPNTIAGNVPGFNTTSGIGFRKATATATDGNNVLISRDAQFTGGTVGFTNSALNVECNAVAGITSNELCGLFRIANAGTMADGSMNVALYSQAVRQAGATGSTWAGTIEVIDRGNTGAATGPLIGLEIDVRANGPDSGLNRGILQLVGTKDDTGGATPAIQFALKIGVETAFGIGASYQKGIHFVGGPYVVGIDMRDVSSFGSAAMWVNSNIPVLWDTAGGMKQVYNSVLEAMTFTDGTNQLRQAFYVTTGQFDTTNGTNKLTFNPLNTGGVVGTSTAHDMIFWANGVEQGRALQAGGLSSASEFFPKASTVAALPACNAGRNGSVRVATDLTAPTFGGALVGGGAVVRPVICNGAAWLS